jgi:hypothetical protein
MRLILKIILKFIFFIMKKESLTPIRHSIVQPQLDKSDPNQTYDIRKSLTPIRHRLDKKSTKKKL